MAGPRPAARGHRGAGASRLAPRLTVYPELALDPERWLDPATRFAVLDRSDAEGLGRDDPGGVFPEQIKAAVEAGTGAEVVQIGRRNTAWYSGAPVEPTDPRARLRPARVARPRRRGARRRAARPGGRRGRDHHAVLGPRRRGGGGRPGGRRAAPGGRRRRRHLRPQPQHQLHERVHLQVPVLRLLQGPAVPQPPRHALPAHPRGHPGAGASRRWPTAPPRCACRAASTPTSTATTTSTSPAPCTRSRPEIHIHGFTALEVTEGAKRLGRAAGRLPAPAHGRRACKTLPGTAAEILDDPVRALLCPDKIDTEEWLEAHRTAHSVGLRSNVTIMFGAVEQPRSWARHLVAHPRPPEGDRRVHRVRARSRSCTWRRRSTSSTRRAAARRSARRCSCTRSAASPTAAGSTTSRCPG